MSEIARFSLPFPPSGNHMWKHTRSGQHYLTTTAITYYRNVAILVRQQSVVANLDEPLEVECEFTPPDHRRRDLDNAWKVVGDGMTRSRFWTDDKWIRKLTLSWGEVRPLGGASIIVRRFHTVANL